MLSLKVKNDKLLLAEKVVSYLLITLIPTAFVLMVCGEWFGTNQTSRNGFTDNLSTASGAVKFLKVFIRDYFVYFTCQSNIFILIWVIVCLVSKKKNFLLGIISNANMTIVCIFFWLGYGTFMFNFSLNIPVLLSTYIHHALTLIFSIILFSLQVCNRNEYKFVSYKKVLVYAWILPTIFIIGDIMTNFTPIFGMYDKNGEHIPGYSPYGIFSAINPNIPDGKYWHIIFSIAFYGAIFGFAYLFYRFAYYKFITNPRYDVLSKTNSSIKLSTILIMILCMVAFVTLFISTFLASSDAQFRNKDNAIGWIYGIIFTCFFVYFGVLLYNFISLSQKSFLGLQKYFIGISLYWCIYTFLSVFVILFRYFQVPGYKEYSNANQILVFGMAHMLVFINALLINLYSSRTIRLTK